MAFLEELFGLSGQRAIVTGAGGGIGRASARALAAAGASVALVDLPGTEDRLQEQATRLADELGAEVIHSVADVSSPEDVHRMIDDVTERLGGIDIAFSNAGVISGGDLDIDYESWRRNVDVNLGGMFLVGRAAAERMIAQGTGGSIINTASMSGMIVNDIFDGTRGGSAYSAAKAGVIQLTKSQATQWVRHKIRVNAISPGYILSGIHQGVPDSVMEFCARRTPMKRLGEVEEVTGAVLYLASPASSFVTGSNLVVDGGYTCW